MGKSPGTVWKIIPFISIAIMGATPLSAEGLCSSMGRPKVITFKWTTLGGMNYYLAGFNVTNDKDIKKIILPLHDQEATRLLKQSECSRAWGLTGVIAGEAIFLFGGVKAVDDFGNNRNNAGFMDLAVFAGGAVVNAVGSLLLAQSTTSEFAAVQRYDRLIRRRRETSWDTSFVPPMEPVLAWKFKF